MSLIKDGKSDVRNHFSPHRNRRSFSLVPAAEPDATGSSGNEEEMAKSKEPDTRASLDSDLLAGKSPRMTLTPGRADVPPVSTVHQRRQP